MTTDPARAWLAGSQTGMPSGLAVVGLAALLALVPLFARVVTASGREE